MVYSSSDEKERNYYWQSLQEALYDFLDDFLPHMEEEENTFQPLLNQYFNYEELKQIQETVISQHEEWKEKVTSEKSLKRFKRDSESSVVVANEVEEDVLRTLPDEILLQIFHCLSDPRDLASASQVCTRWNKISKSGQLWRHVPLSQWERGIWSWQFVDMEPVVEADHHLEHEEYSPIYDDFVPLCTSIGKSMNVLSHNGLYEINFVTCVADLLRLFLPENSLILTN